MQSGLQPLSMDTPILPGSKHSPYVKAPSNFGNSELGYVYLAKTRQAATSWVRQIAKDYWFGSSMGKNPIQAIVAQVDPRQLDPKLLDKDPYARLPSLRYKIAVVDKEATKPILNYVRKKYISNLKELYDGNPHNERKNKCVICGQPAKNKCCSKSCGGKLVFKKSPHGPRFLLNDA